VTSAPTTFLVDGEGVVRWARRGPLTPQVVERELLPMMERYSN
jgi:cytochrome c biogenesis protein CcmG/thiol:disulfide interchange protein DsbE